MRPTIGAAILALLLTGCGEIQDRRTDASSPGEREVPPAPLLAAPATLDGAYRGAGIDGAPFDEPYGLALGANDREIWWTPRCAGHAIMYRIEGDRFMASAPEPPPSPSPPPAAGEPPPPPPPLICGIAPPPRLSEVVDVLLAGERIERTPENGIRISGGGRSVTLFSQ
ncbi:hypothetical protein [Qipengyuania spongiae]|uniref:Uncharacterized protein n=1 Tax=Qipengyuania spongiae TaxID=2909673 RepID=A0ABY5T2X3_9SPHN|nr:hypothetical protein [Qipengyuania spongiae]UVI39706.1 hypothetical protein L1F33_01725 [Qipengyuania spongiae]